MSGLVECPRCDGFGLIDVEDSGTWRYGPTSMTCPRCGGLEVLDADESGRPLDDWPARDMGGWREPRR